jgi:UDP-N-acetylglucosamine acyltransferase
MVGKDIDSSVIVHPTAIVHPGAVIGAGTEIGPFTIIGSKVVIGEKNSIASHVVIEGCTVIGDENQIYQFASIGGRPQDLKFRGEDSRLEIGNSNIIREYVTVHPGTAGGGMLTKIGDSNLLMASAHVAHDVIMGDRNILANSCALAGHIKVGDGVIAGGLSGVHQFARLGTLSYIGAGSMVSKDVPPFCMVQGDRAGLIGLNVIGMRRSGIGAEVIRSLKDIYRLLFRTDGFLGAKKGEESDRFIGKTFRQKAQDLLTRATFAEEKLLLDFILSSERGLCDSLRQSGRVVDTIEEEEA